MCWRCRLDRSEFHGVGLSPLCHLASRPGEDRGHKGHTNGKRARAYSYQRPPDPSVSVFLVATRLIVLHKLGNSWLNSLSTDISIRYSAIPAKTPSPLIEIDEKPALSARRFSKDRVNT